MNKEELRKKYILIRKEVKEKQEKSHIIFNKIIECDEYKRSKVIGLYKNLSSEVDTNELIEYSLENKIVLLPRVEGDNMNFYRIFNNEEYAKSDFGIYEPVNIEEFNEPIDLLIVPGICFDKNRNRIGFGKGYYDKYLDNKDIKTIGICFEEQISDELIVTDKYDKKLNKIITDKNIYI